MEDIVLFVNTNKILRLKYLSAIHPSKVHLKADNWKFIYQLSENSRPLDNNLYTGRAFIFENKKIVVLEEYDISILNESAIQTDNDVTDIIEDKIIFKKCYYDKDVEYEVDLSKLDTENLLFEA